MKTEIGPNPDEVRVKARYFLPVETEEENLRKIQRKLTMNLMQEGYAQTDVDPEPFGPAQRTMDFRRVQVPESEDSFSDRLKGLLGRNGKTRSQELSHDQFLDGLERVRDDLPFRLAFHFKSVEVDEQPGYDVLVDSTPVLLQKYRQLSMPDDYAYNLQDVVEQNKNRSRTDNGEIRR